MQACVYYCFNWFLQLCVLGEGQQQQKEIVTDRTGCMANSIRGVCFFFLQNFKAFADSVHIDSGKIGCWMEEDWSFDGLDSRERIGGNKEKNRNWNHLPKEKKHLREGYPCGVGERYKGGTKKKESF